VGYKRKHARKKKKDTKENKQN
jgi:hypothetical protein